jgi:hypothetical protein
MRRIVLRLSRLGNGIESQSMVTWSAWDRMTDKNPLQVTPL